MSGLNMNSTGKGSLQDPVLKAASEKCKIPISVVNETAKASPRQDLADFITRTCSVPKKLLMIWLNGCESLKEGSFRDRAKFFD